MCFGGKGTGNASHASDIQGANYLNAQQVAARPYQPYTGELVAPLTPVQNQVGGLLQSAPGMGQGAIGTGINAATAGTQYQAPQIQAGSYNPAQAGAAQIDPSLLPLLQAPNGISGIQSYLNPYTQDVTNTVLSDLNRQNQQQLVNNARSATADGAFGGTRQGVADALTNEAFQRTAANTLANLNNQGFNTAAGLLQNNQQMGLQAGGENLGALLSAAGQNAGFQQGSGLFNAGARNTASQFNLDNALKAGYFNQNATNTAQSLNNQASGLLGNLGSQQQNTFLNGTGALGEFGGLQQQNQQALDTSNYQQFLNQFNYPIQMQSLLNSVLSGGAAPQVANPQGQMFAQNAAYGLLGNALGGANGSGGLLGGALGSGLNSLDLAVGGPGMGGGGAGLLSDLGTGLLGFLGL